MFSCCHAQIVHPWCQASIFCIFVLRGKNEKLLHESSKTWIAFTCFFCPSSVVILFQALEVGNGSRIPRAPDNTRRRTEDRSIRKQRPFAVICSQKTDLPRSENRESFKIEPQGTPGSQAMCGSVRWIQMVCSILAVRFPSLSFFHR
jgi:hypothetical protein